MNVLAAMQAFVSVVERGSFSAAGRERGLGQAAISERVARLEAHLGIPLLQRSTRHLALTPAGRLYYERCRHVVEAAAHAEQVADEQTGPLRGRLRIASPTCLGEVVLPNLLQRFREQHPELVIELVLCDRALDPVTHGVDLAIWIGDVPIESRGAQHAAWIRRVLAATPAYLQAHGVPEVPADLKQHAFIRVAGYFADNTLPLKHRGTLQIHPVRTAWVVANWHAVPALLSSDAGIAPVPCLAAEHELRSGHWQRVLPDYEIPDAAVWLAYPSERQPTEKARAARAFLLRELAALCREREPTCAPSCAAEATSP